jgi:hypothetical protein
MSRRNDRRRREDRREREPLRDLQPAPVPMLPELVRANWMRMLSTGRCRGSSEPLFQSLDLVFGPTVQLDPTSATSMPEQLAEKTVVALVTQTLDQKPS